MVVYNTNSALSIQVKDYYIAARRLNPAHALGVAFAHGIADTGWTGAESYTNLILPIADYILAHDIDCVLFSSEVPVQQLVADQLTPDGCTITHASPAVVTYDVGDVFTLNNPINFSTTGTLPAPLVAGTVYYTRNYNVGARTFEVSATSGGASINTTTDGTGTHTVSHYNGYYMCLYALAGHALWRKVKGSNPTTLAEKFDHTRAWDGFTNSDLDMVEATETYGTSSSLLLTTNHYDKTAYCRPVGRIGYIYAAANSETFTIVKRIIDDAIYAETLSAPLAPIHVQHYDRAYPYITGLQAERARRAIVAKGIPVLHNSTNHTELPDGVYNDVYDSLWPIQPPANSYGSWSRGEFSGSPLPVSGLITAAIINVAIDHPWLNSYQPVRGSWIVNPTSGPNAAATAFLRKGGSAATSTLTEPLADNLPNVHTFTQRILEGRMFAEAYLMSTPTDCYMGFVCGDPMFAPCASMQKNRISGMGVIQ
jgi:hypothetical protein